MRCLQIAHVSTVHCRSDPRIFQKMCRSLANSGHSVHFVVADGEGDAFMDGVKVLDVGKPAGRASRVLVATRRVRDRVIDLGADIIHLHDPELLAVGASIARKGHRVVFDAHEDVPKQIMTKHYIPRISRRPVSLLWAQLERKLCARLTGVIAATPSIAQYLSSTSSRLAVVRNYPMLAEFPSLQDGGLRERAICYVGAITSARGIIQLVQALELTSTQPRLLLAGRFSDSGLRDRVRALPGWRLVEELGQIDRAAVLRVFDRSRIGMVCIHPEPNHLEALPTKLFEYMAAGLPVIASNFPLWRTIITQHGCGITVDPLDPASIAQAIDSLLAPESAHESEAMGRRGRLAIQSHFSWESEYPVLLNFYERCFGTLNSASCASLMGRIVI
jgi:glycosyltransferase involved in cell wall biosynthesis